MENTDKTEFQRRMDVLHAFFRADMDDDMAEEWWDSLREFPTDEVYAQIRHARDTAQFMPRPSEIRGPLVEQAKSRRPRTIQCAFEYNGHRCPAAGVTTTGISIKKPENARWWCADHAEHLHDMQASVEIMQAKIANRDKPRPPTWNERVVELGMQMDAADAVQQANEEFGHKPLGEQNPKKQGHKRALQPTDVYSAVRGFKKPGGDR